MFLIETHLHTSEASACGMVPGEDWPSYMKDKGFAGMIVTDHFFSGNSSVPGNLPWEERVRVYCSGYEHARRAAEGIGFSVFFSVEYNFQGDEYLLYGVDKEWLLDHPRLLAYSRRQVCDAVHEAGGIMIQAHPFRERHYLTKIHLTPDVTDGIEVYNAANESYMNALAAAYAKKHHFPVTAGSDLHYYHDRALGGMLFEEMPLDIGEFVAAFRNGEGVPVRLLDGEITRVCDLPEECTVTRSSTLPVILHK